MYYKNVKDDVVSGLPLAINIFIKLRDDILQGKLKDGEKLTEQRICNEYNVSRTPVREAFRLLEQEGIINMIPNRGAFVTGFTERDISDMYEMRKVYEELAFKWATERITDEELEEIKNGYELMEFYTHKKDEEKITQQNFHFHELIYKASHNRMLTQILTSFQYYTKQFNSTGGVDPELSNIDQMLEEHYEILQALEQRDAKHGVEVVKRHLEQAKDRAGYGEFEVEEI